jgi:predicted HTH transcriptional regulator
MYVACCCGVAYAFVAAFFVVPGLSSVAGILFQALLFVVIAAAAAIVLKHRETQLPALPEDDAEAIRTVINTGENDRIEFKLLALWSADLTKEEILASESSEIRKYRTNASKFIIARSIAGFLNTDGGDLIIGVQEDRIKNSIQAVGIEEDYRTLQEKDRNPDGYRRMIVDSIIQKYLPEIFNTASRFIHLSFPSLSGRTLCHVHITPADKPVFVSIGNEEHFFIRVDASTRSLTGKVLTQYILTRFSSQ